MFDFFKKNTNKSNTPTDFSDEDRPVEVPRTEDVLDDVLDAPQGNNSVDGDATDNLDGDDVGGVESDNSIGDSDSPDNGDAGNSFSDNGNIASDDGATSTYLDSEASDSDDKGFAEKVSDAFSGDDDESEEASDVDDSADEHSPDADTDSVQEGSPEIDSFGSDEADESDPTSDEGYTDESDDSRDDDDGIGESADEEASFDEPENTSLPDDNMDEILNGGEDDEHISYDDEDERIHQERANIAAQMSALEDKLSPFGDVDDVSLIGGDIPAHENPEQHDGSVVGGPADPHIPGEDDVAEDDPKPFSCNLHDPVPVIYDQDFESLYELMDDQDVFVLRHIDVTYDDYIFPQTARIHDLGLGEDARFLDIIHIIRNKSKDVESPLVVMFGIDKALKFMFSSLEGKNSIFENMVFERAENMLDEADDQNIRIAAVASEMNSDILYALEKVHRSPHL